MGPFNHALRTSVGGKRATAALVVLVLFGFAFFVLPGLIIPGDVAPERDRLSLENNVRTAAAQAIAGLLVLAGLTLTARSLAITREGQFTERFSRSVAHLANESLDVRLGGIYGLHRLARNSPDDHYAVMEVLLAYAQRRFPWPPTGAETLTRERVPPDLEAICMALRKRRVDFETPEERPSLEHLDLRLVGLHDVDLKGGLIAQTNLANAYLHEANLGGVVFVDADLSDAMLQEASLREAHASAGGVALRGIFAVRADFRDSDFHGVSFVEADLTDADLRGADLSEADLTNAILTGARLSGAKLQGARLLAQGLTSQQISEAATDATTILPADHSQP